MYYLCLPLAKGRRLSIAWSWRVRISANPSVGLLYIQENQSTPREKPISREPLGRKVGNHFNLFQNSLKEGSLLRVK